MADQWWHTGGYMTKREGNQCQIWLGHFREEQSALVPFDESMPDWLFDSSLNFFGDGVAFKVEIPRSYADAECLDGIIWRNWARQPYDDKDAEELYAMLVAAAD